MLERIRDNGPVNLIFDDGKLRWIMAYLEAMAKAGPVVVAQELNKTVLDWQREIKRHMPVGDNQGGKDGHLPGLARNSVAVSPADAVDNPPRAAVGTNVPYVPYLEFGTKWIAQGKVLEWKIGDSPILDWAAKRAGLEELASKGPEHRGYKSAQALLKKARGDEQEFMPPFRASWALIAERNLQRLRRRLALLLKQGKV